MTKTMIVTVPQTVIAWWEHTAEVPAEGNWELVEAYDYIATFKNADTGEVLEVDLEHTGDVEYEGFEGNEWDLAEAEVL